MFIIFKDSFAMRIQNEIKENGYEATIKKYKNHQKNIEELMKKIEANKK